MIPDPPDPGEHDLVRVLHDALVPAREPATTLEVLDHLVRGVGDLLPEVVGAAVVTGLAEGEVCAAASGAAVRRIVEADLARGGPLARAVGASAVTALALEDLAALETASPSTTRGSAVRWREVGIEQVQVIPLREGAERRARLHGALVVAASQTLDADGVELARTIAGAAMVALERASFGRQMEQALESRSTVGAAIGLVMERYGLTWNAAWSYLTRRASDEERKVHDVAAELLGRARAERPGGDR